MIITSPTFYPRYAFNKARTMRGMGWRDLMDWVGELPAVHPEVMAFTLTVRRLRALIGLDREDACAEPTCAVCTMNLLDRFEGSEHDLLQEYHRTLDEVQGYLNRGQKRRRINAAPAAVGMVA